MKTAFVQTTLYEDRDLKKILSSKELRGRISGALSSQPPHYEKVPLSFCSFINSEYTETYGNREGVIFETDEPVVYACPTDTFNLMRSARFLPGHERFIFNSIEAMLEKYPTPKDFQEDFKRYFEALNPQEIYPHMNPRDAENHHAIDYSISSWHPWNSGCTEITFRKPTPIKNIQLFYTKNDLHTLLGIESK